MKGTWRIKNVKRVSVKPEKHREIFKYFRNISWNISRNISGPKISWNFTSLLLILPSQTSCYIREWLYKIQNTNINLRRLLYVIAICFECEEMTEIRGNVIESSRCRSCRLPAVSEWPMYQHFNCGVANLAILRKHSIAACWTDARRILRDNKNL